MAKIRTIKPDFWTDGDMLRLPYEVRLFYIGMWNHACDRGHLADDSFGLKLKILPADPVDGEEMVSKLVAAGRVTRFVLPDGRPFLFIPRFTDHQRIEARWKSRCAACAHEDSPKLTEPHASFEEETRGTESHAEGREGKGREGKGREGKEPAARPREAPPAPTCGKHSGWEHDERCRNCQRDREAHTKWQSEFDAAQRAAARRKPHACPHGFPPHEACEKCGDAWPGK